MPSCLPPDKPAPRAAIAPPGVAVRAVGPAHAPVLARLHAACFERGWSQASMATLLSQPAVRTWLAVDRPLAPMGFLMVQAACESAEILTLGVLRHRRGTGLGALLVRTATDILQAADVAELVLEVAETNHAARRLYERLGFEKIGRRRGYVVFNGRRQDALVMRLGLASRRSRAQP